MVSGSGFRHETQECLQHGLLSPLEAEIAKTKGEIEDSQEVKSTKLLEEKLTVLEEKHSCETQKISLQVLDIIGKCGFDALQTRGAKDEVYYSRLHRFRQDLGRSVSIAASDAHDVNNIFCCDYNGEAFSPFAKIKIPRQSDEASGLFSQLRDQVIRFAETRFTCIDPKRISSWIEGIEIVPDAENAKKFWPFSEEEKNDLQKNRFGIAFSRNLNTIIGGRGSGKSALIEALAFINDRANDFSNHSGKNTPDWYRRAEATLTGCKVKVCWKSWKHDFPKKALFLSRYFDIRGKHGEITPALLNGKEPTQSIDLFDYGIEIYRIHDIEKSAKPENLRVLFDSICGKRIKELGSEVSEVLSKLSAQRKKMCAIANGIFNLTQERSPLRQYARRKQEFALVNKPEIKSEFKKIDETDKAKEIAQSILEKWKEIHNDFDVESKKEVIETFVQRAIESLENPEHEGDVEKPEHLPYCEKLLEVLASSKSEEGTCSRIFSLLDSLNNEYVSFQERIQKEIQGILEENKHAKEKLAERGQPVGSSDRLVKKQSFEKSKKDLEAYKKLWHEWNVLLKDRNQLFDEFEKLCQERSEIRNATAENITSNLKRDLDSDILVVEAKANPCSDKSKYIDWLTAKVDWSGCKYKSQRIDALVVSPKAAFPANVRSALLAKDSSGSDVFFVDKDSAVNGRISEEEAEKIFQTNKAITQLEAEMLKDEDVGLWESLPEEIQCGLYTFAVDDKNGELLVDRVLTLDEIELEDMPTILMNDRPRESSQMRPIDELSPGQRCSAILPILLLNGTSPLIIDQPEDNLDNRLIRQVIVNVLGSIKLRRQVIMATHNPNLPVLGDAEQVIALRASDDKACQLECCGDLDSKDVVKNITEILEGGREAFQFRQQIYQNHWKGGAELF